MLVKKITYQNFEGVEETKEFHFNLTKAELIEVVSKYPDDFQSYIKEISAANNKEQLVLLFRTLILKAYGIKEGTTFKKSHDISEQFSSTEAYSELFFELFSDVDKMIEFFNALVKVNIPDLKK